MDSEMGSSPLQQEKQKLYSGLESIRSQMRSVTQYLSTMPILLRAFIGIALLMATPLVFALILTIVVGMYLLSLLKESLKHISMVALISIVGVPSYLYFTITLPLRKHSPNPSWIGSEREPKTNTRVSSVKKSTRSTKTKRSPTLN